MARFQQKTLDPLIQDADAKINAAGGIVDITARTDGLLAAREDAGKAFEKAAGRQAWKMAGAGLLLGIGVLATFGGVMTATSLVALLAGTTGFAIPLAIAGAGAAIAGAVSLAVGTEHYSAIRKAWNAASSKIDAAVGNLVKSYPEETSKSSRLAAFLKRTFNPAASGEAAQTPAKTAAPAPARQSMQP